MKTWVEPYHISTAYYNVQKGLAALDRVQEVMQTDLAIQEAEDGISLSQFKEGITFEQVSFSYGQLSKPVLEDISFQLPAGQSIALVGASGAGKSTLVDLIPRLYDVTSGTIFLDGRSIKEYTLESLRSLIGFVSQEAILFNDTIFNNITFGLEHIEPSQVEQAARLAYAHEFILETPNSYQTVIGDKGVKLSGGQRQRLTIARAILKNPPILILDEATSALDAESEKWVKKAIYDLMQDRTVIVIAHRLSTIQHADMILVLKDGKIIERGTHKDLLERKGEYLKFVELQTV